jgi:hypothetical protein
MNGALAWRFWRDGLVLLVILGAAITATEVLLMGALGEFSTQELATWMRVEFVQRIMKTFLGADLTPDISATGFMALGFTHPLIYALIWTFILTAATRVPAAEVERGTSDLLYTLPLSRGAIHRSAGLSLALATTLLTGATLAGVSLGQLLVPMWEPLDLGKLTIVAGNLLALNLCVAAVATAVSACTSRRGVAIAIILAWLLASFCWSSSVSLRSSRAGSDPPASCTTTARCRWCAQGIGRWAICSCCWVWRRCPGARA